MEHMRVSQKTHGGRNTDQGVKLRIAEKELSEPTQLKCFVCMYILCSLDESALYL